VLTGKSTSVWRESAKVVGIERIDADDPTQIWKDERACERYPILILRALEANFADGVRLRAFLGSRAVAEGGNPLESML
jgi:hypothetical protein